MPAAETREQRKDAREQLIRSIETLPQELENAILGLSDQQLDTPYRDGGWTVRQVVHHLADSHLNAYTRTKLILTEEHPTLKPYNQDAWSNLPDAAQPVDSSLSILRGLHHRWTVLFRGVSESEWGRAAFHPEVGEMTTESLLASYARHGENHVSQIKSLRVSKRW
jgi:hypothetical protein